MTRTDRPWGYYETLLTSGLYQVKRIVVAPNQAISLQSHKRRDESWIIVEGEGIITIDNLVRTLGQGDQAFIKREQLHRASNHSKSELVIIEVQLGDYLGEDDIIRYDDRYGRA